MSQFLPAKKKRVSNFPFFNLFAQSSYTLHAARAKEINEILGIFSYLAFAGMFSFSAHLRRTALSATERASMAH